MSRGLGLLCCADVALVDLGGEAERACRLLQRVLALAHVDEHQAGKEKEELNAIEENNMTFTYVLLLPPNESWSRYVSLELR